MVGIVISLAKFLGDALLEELDDSGDQAIDRVLAGPGDFQTDLEMPIQVLHTLG